MLISSHHHSSTLPVAPMLPSSTQDSRHIGSPSLLFVAFCSNSSIYCLIDTDVMKWLAFSKDYSVARQFFGALSGCFEYKSIYAGVALLQHWDKAGHGILKPESQGKLPFDVFGVDQASIVAGVRTVQIFSLLFSWSLNLGKLGCRSLAGWCNSFSPWQTCVVPQNSGLAFTVAL